MVEFIKSSTSSLLRPPDKPGRPFGVLAFKKPGRAETSPQELYGTTDARKLFTSPTAGPKP